MVQAPRLDLMRLAALISAVLLVGGLGDAVAQTLLQDPPLTTLLKPQPLDRSRPLLPQDRGEGGRQAGQAGQDATGCSTSAATGPGSDPARRDGAPGAATAGGLPGSAAGSGKTQYGAARAGSAMGGGSGPGEFAQFMPSAPNSGTPNARKDASTSSMPTTSPAAGGVDKPLYGGNDRPLWSTGETRPKPTGAATAADGSAKTTPTDPVAQSGLPRDKPLWAEPGQTDAAAPDSPASDRSGMVALRRSLAGLAPCNPTSRLAPR